AGDRLQLIALPVLPRNILSANQYLSRLRIKLHLASRQHLANRSASHFKRMVQADERTCFCKPVTLHHHVAQPPPELFSVLVERRAAGDDGPELPAKMPPDLSEAPPALQIMFFFRAVPVFFDQGSEVA